MARRLHYIDWLRVMAFGLLFLFHATRFFDTYPWHIKNVESSTAINYFVEFVHSWRMQLIFLISGAGTYFALQSRRGKFLNDRIMRLIIPYVFGVIILIPPQKYLEAIFQSSFDGSYLSFLTYYPARIMNEGIGFNLNWIGYLGYHIWYLAYLFMQTLLLLPLFKVMKNHRGIQRIYQAISSNIYSLSLLIIPLIISEFALRPFYPDYLDWADFAMYSLFFLYGFMFQLNDNFIRIIEKNAYIFLGAGITSWGTYLLFKESLDQMSIPSHSWQYLGVLLIRNINNFSWVLAFLGLAKKFLNFKHSLLNHLNQSILPFYILHQTVIIGIGYFVIQWDLSLLAKFMIILTVSFLSTIALYQIVWRSKLLRILFGMKLKK